MSSDLQSRTVRKVIRGFEFADDTRAREVVAEYDDGDVYREIEVEENERYVPRFREINDE